MTTVSNSGQSSTGETDLFAQFLPEHLRDSGNVTPKSLADALQEMEVMLGKYVDLVWLARKPLPGDPAYEAMANRFGLDALKSIDEKREQLRDLYPEECALLTGNGTGDWQHGFHSGVVASLRWFQQAMLTPHLVDDDLCWGGIESAYDSFPDLTT